MSESCGLCPCPGDCLRRAHMCRAIAARPDDPMTVRSICERSRLGRINGESPGAVAQPPPAAKPIVTTSSAIEDGTPPAEAIRLLNIAKACRWRSFDPGCGCNGARCSIKRGSIVSHRDCIACASTYGES